MFVFSTLLGCPFNFQNLYSLFIFLAQPKPSFPVAWEKYMSQIILTFSPPTSSPIPIVSIIEKKKGKKKQSQGSGVDGFCRMIWLGLSAQTAAIKPIIIQFSTTPKSPHSVRPAWF